MKNINEIIQYVIDNELSSKFNTAISTRNTKFNNCYNLYNIS